MKNSLVNYINLVDKTNSSHIKLQFENSQLRRMIENKDKTELTELIINDNIDSVVINNEVTDCPILVYRFFSGGCHSCTDSLLTFLNSLSPKTKNNLLIISNYSADSELNAVLHFNGVKDVKFKNLSQLDLSFDSQNIPYFFVLEDQIAHTFFIPDKENKRRTINYLEYIFNQYLRFDEINMSYDNNDSQL